MTETADPVTKEIRSALADLQRAVEKTEEEETCGAAIAIGIAIGKLQSLIERRLGTTADSKK